MRSQRNRELNYLGPLEFRRIVFLDHTGSFRAWLEAATSTEGTSPVLIALAYSWIGETDEALAWLERGYRERDPQIIILKAHYVFDPLRSDPRYHGLLRRIGFPEE